MHVVEIQASQAALWALERSPELVVKLAEAEQVGPDRWRVGAYADEAKVDELRAAGYDVTVLMTSRERREELRALLEPDE